MWKWQKEVVRMHPGWTFLYELRYFLTERDTHPAHFLRGCEARFGPTNKVKRLPKISLKSILSVDRWLVPRCLSDLRFRKIRATFVVCFSCSLYLTLSLPLSLFLRTRQAFGGGALPASLGVLRSSNSSLSKASQATDQHLLVHFGVRNLHSVFLFLPLF